MNNSQRGLVLASGLLLGLVALAPPALAEERRVDLFDTSSTRTGSAIVNERTGRVDTFDKKSNRTGYGIIDRTSGRIDRYDVKGNRTGSGTLSGSRGGKR